MTTTRSLDLENPFSLSELLTPRIEIDLKRKQDVHLQLLNYTKKYLHTKPPTIFYDHLKSTDKWSSKSYYNISPYTPAYNLLLYLNLNGPGVLPESPLLRDLPEFWETYRPISNISCRFLREGLVNCPMPSYQIRQQILAQLGSCLREKEYAISARNTYGSRDLQDVHQTFLLLILECTLLELYKFFQEDISNRVKSSIDRPNCYIGTLPDLSISHWAIFESYYLVTNYSEVWDPKIYFESRFYGAYLNYAWFQTLMMLLCI